MLRMSIDKGLLTKALGMAGDASVKRGIASFASTPTIRPEHTTGQGRDFGYGAERGYQTTPLLVNRARGLADPSQIPGGNSPMAQVEGQELNSPQNTKLPTPTHAAQPAPSHVAEPKPV